MPTQPDDLTMTALRAIQRQRTTPQGGWLDTREVAALINIAPREAFHLNGSMKELFDAGMIERRFNAVLGRDEYRSIGTLPAADHSVAFPGDHSEPDLLAEAREVDPAPTTIFPAPIKGTIHAAFVMDYRTDKWATMCGRQVKDPATIEHRHAPVQCPKCAEALR